MTKPIIVIGGYGSAGRHISEYLIRYTDIPRILIAGRNMKKAFALSTKLNNTHEGYRAAAIFMDAADEVSLRQVFVDVNIAVNASSTAMHSGLIADVARDTGTDYFDIQYSSEKSDTLRRLAARVAQSGRCFITDGGIYPGLPAAMVRVAAGYFDRIEKADVAGAARIDWSQYSFSEQTATEFLDEVIRLQSTLFRDGAWRNADMCGKNDFREVEFGGAIGRRTVFPMHLEELQALPGMYPSLRQAGFHVDGFNWFVDRIVFPLSIYTGKRWPKPFMPKMAKLLSWGTRRFMEPGFGSALKLEASGQKNGKPKSVEIVIRHDDGYVLTAIAAVAGILQVLDGSIRKPGIHLQALAVDPVRLLADMKKMGAGVEISETQ